MLMPGDLVEVRPTTRHDVVPGQAGIVIGLHKTTFDETSQFGVTRQKTVTEALVIFPLGMGWVDTDCFIVVSR